MRKAESKGAPVENYLQLQSEFTFAPAPWSSSQIQKELLASLLAPGKPGQLGNQFRPLQLGRASRGKGASIAAGALRHGTEREELLDGRAWCGFGGGRVGRCLSMVATQHGTEFFMQTAMGAEKSQPHGHARYSQAFGNFVSGILQNIAQETNLTEIGRELRDGAREERAHFAACVALLWSRSTRGKVFGNVLALFAIAILKGDVFEIAPLAKQVDRSVRGDASDPSVQVVLEFILFAGKLINAREGLHQGILPSVFGVCGIPRQSQGTTIKTWRVGEDQGSERLAVTETRLCKKRRGFRGFQAKCCAAHVAQRGGMPSAMRSPCVS